MCCLAKIVIKNNLVCLFFQAQENPEPVFDLSNCELDEVSVLYGP